MGIKYFYSQWLKKSNFKGVILNSIPTKYLYGLSIDMNGLFHEIAKMFYYIDENTNVVDKSKLEFLENSTEKELIDKYYEKLDENLEELLRIFRPSRYLFLCVDGLGNASKITQQKSRRYTSSQMKSKDKRKSFFDSNCITPGTTFMNDLDAHIIEWINKNRQKLPEMVIYSSHKMPGEGEHKIYKLMKDYLNLEEIENIDPYYHGIYGLDGDLYMLSLLSVIHNIVIIRKEKNNSLNYVDIKAFKKELIHKLTYEWTYYFNPKIVIQDYVIIVFLIGNDFLPSIVSLEDIKVSLNHMLEIYNQLEKPLTDEFGQIIWNNFYNFIYFLEREERNFLIKKASKQITYEFKTLDSVLIKKKNSSFIPNLNYSDNKYIIKEFTDEQFYQFRNNWYSKIFNPQIKLKDFEEFEENEVEKISLSYIYGIQWVLNYYIGNSVNNNYFYQQLYAPLLVDLLKSLKKSINDEKTVNIKDVQELPNSIKLNLLYQLVAVIPPYSINIIPEKFRHLILDDGPLSYMCPIEFKLDFEGKNKDYEAIAILPQIDLNSLKREVDLLCPKIKKWAKDENGVAYNYYDSRVPNGMGIEKINFISIIKKNPIKKYKDTDINQGKDINFDFKKFFKSK
jgi:5'-3' exonuclease